MPENDTPVDDENEAGDDAIVPLEEDDADPGNEEDISDTVPVCDVALKRRIEMLEEARWLRSKLDDF